MWDSRSSASNCLHPLQATRPTCHPFSTAKFGRRREHCVRQQRILPQAKQSQEDGGNSQLPAILKIANGLAGSAASLVPASVPRPVAKLGVVGISSLVALWLFGKLVSTVFTVAAVGGAVFLFLKSRGAKSEASSDVADDAIDPVASARRIMDKYK
ncbi:TPA: hypothetical protein ACH3X2_011110 [Trebouxia sp. C0005]|nr:MAG: hypothetical protein FRX49_04220 [Trebouxia sp. A1-2]